MMDPLVFLRVPPKMDTVQPLWGFDPRGSPLNYLSLLDGNSSSSTSGLHRLFYLSIGVMASSIESISYDIARKPRNIALEMGRIHYCNFLFPGNSIFHVVTSMKNDLQP